MGRVSRNILTSLDQFPGVVVAPRMGRVSRNFRQPAQLAQERVAPRMGRVSRNSLTHPPASWQGPSRPAWGV